jgi:hypothetical protein
MSVIEDGRQVIQDFLAPELRAIAVRLDSLEKKVDDNERRAETRHADTLLAISRLADYTSLRERVVRLESKESTQH